MEFQSVESCLENCYTWYDRKDQQVKDYFGGATVLMCQEHGIIIDLGEG